MNKSFNTSFGIADEKSCYIGVVHLCILEAVECFECIIAFMVQSLSSAFGLFIRFPDYTKV